MQMELRAYRANPTDRRFSKLYDVAIPWLKASGIATLRTYHRLSISGSLDDLTIEGAMSLSRSARRFVYVCKSCGSSHVHANGLLTHQMRVHGKRGVAFVSLSTFSKTSARLAMRRTARRLVRSEILEPEVDLGVDDRAESSMLFEVLVSRMGDKLWSRARESLRAILMDEWTQDDVDRVRSAVSAHLG